MSAITPAELKPESFAKYPPEARALLAAHIELLRQLPLIFLPLILREAITYDWRFPMERQALEAQFTYLEGLSKVQRDQALSSMAACTLNSDLLQDDWINQPSVFIEHLTAHLWATHQMDAFRDAADRYAAGLRQANPEDKSPQNRLGIVVIGQGVEKTQYPLFRKLRPHGAYFSRVSTEDGLTTLLSAVAARAQEHPEDYAHWYIDGGAAMPIAPGVTTVSYAALEAPRAALLDRMQRVIQSGSAGPEALRTDLALLKPQEIGLPTDEKSAVLSHFQLNLLTEGSGTQIFSTTFAQWAARETLRRAQPSTLLVRFAPRQRQEPMNELLSNQKRAIQLDPEGSLIDADMAAYYTWLNQQRLPGSENAAFLAWFEGHNEAVAIGPALPKGTASSAPTTLKQILGWLA
jgi:hypothetical protein